MTNLVIYPTFLCPFACQYCLFKDKLSFNEILSLETLKDFLDKSIQYFDSIIVSGGDPLSLDKSYTLSLYNLLKSYNKPITLKAYPYTRENIPNDINYDFSYDFMAKPRAFECWDTLITFKHKFKITTTLSPLLFKYHPNNLLKKMAQLPNLTEVEFVPYCKNKNNQFDITKNGALVKMNELILGTQLNLPFKITNIEKMKEIIAGTYKPSTEVSMFPNGKLYVDEFVDNILVHTPLTNSLDGLKPLEYPFDIDMYSIQFQERFKLN